MILGASPARPNTVSGWSANQWFTASTAAPSSAGSTSASPVQSAPLPGVPAARLWKNSTSTTTSVPAAARMLPSGKRNAPSKSAMPAMCARAVSSLLSMVKRLVTNAARPPGFSRSTERAMK